MVHFLQLTVMCLCLSFSTYVYFVSVSKRSGITTGLESVHHEVMRLKRDHFKFRLFEYFSLRQTLVSCSLSQAIA